MNNAGQAPLHRAAVSGLNNGVAVCGILLEAGAKVACKDSRGNTALHLAALQGDQRCVDILLSTEAGKSVIASQNSSGRTPMHYAVLSGRKAAVEALLLAGADRLLKDNAGSNCVDLATREVAEKEEREQRAKAKGLVETEGLQPAREILQLLQVRNQVPLTLAHSSPVTLLTRPTELRCEKDRAPHDDEEDGSRCTPVRECRGRVRSRAGKGGAPPDLQPLQVGHDGSAEGSARRRRR
jgi:hypothetical protein